MNRKHIAIAFLACILAGRAAAWAAPQEKPPAEGQKPDQKDAQKKGTGVVPPGVKLAQQMPGPSPAKPYKFPKPATKTLANGLRVFVLSAAEQPAIAVRLVFTEGGSIHDPAGKPGVASMTATLLTQGTTKRSAQDIASAIDFVGGSLGASADNDGAYITANVVKKDLSLAMDLLSDVARNAAFLDDELTRQRQQLLSNLQVQYVDAGYLADSLIERVLFGSHPYGLPTEGTPDSVRKFSRADIAGFRDAWYVPNHALLAFAGDIMPEAAFAAAEKYFGAWPKKEIPAARISAPANRRGARVFLIDKPDAVQSQIRVGRAGIARNHPDYIPLLVANRIFGGGFNSRLSTEVRIRKGLTYGAYSNFGSLKYAGAFQANTFTRTAATAEATRLVVDLMDKMATGEVTTDELHFAGDYIVGVFPIQSETPEQVAGRILTAAQYELPADYYDTFREKVAAVTPAGVQSMATRHFGTADIDVVVVGNVKEFRDTLKKNFPSAQFEEIPYDQVDLLNADLRRPKEVATAATPESLERGRQILTAAAQAAGGDALDKIESVALVGTADFSTPQGNFTGQIKFQVSYPDKYWAEVQLPGFVIQQGSDGKAAWLASPQGAVDLPASQVVEVQRSIDLLGGWGIFRQARAGKAEAQFLGEKDFQGKKALMLEWSPAPPKAGDAPPAGKVSLFFDPQTNQFVGAGYRATTLQGAFDTVQIWSDFRPVEGVLLPFHSVTLRDGAKYSEQSITDVKLNVKVDPALFAKPKS